jgi:excisionase family DNA binding protein
VTGGLLSARQVAEYLGVSTETVLRWTRRGELPAIRLPGGAIRYREDDIARCEEEWATTARGVVTQPAGRRPAGNLASVTQPDSEEVN